MMWLSVSQISRVGWISFDQFCHVFARFSAFQGKPFDLWPAEIRSYRSLKESKILGICCHDLMKT